MSAIEHGRNHPGETPRKIDLNHASREELMTIPGIGPEMAEKLMRCRDERAPVSKGEDKAQHDRLTLAEQVEDELIARLYV